MNRCSFEFSQSNCEVPVGLSAVGGLAVGAIDLVNRPMNNFKSYLIFSLVFWTNLWISYHNSSSEVKANTQRLQDPPDVFDPNPQMVHNFLESV